MDNSFIKNSLKIIRYLAVLRAIQISAREWGEENKNPSSSPSSTSSKELKDKEPILKSKL